MTSMLTPQAFPESFSGEEALEDFMTLPSQPLLDDMQRLEGDLLLLGVGGKMGPTLARLAKRAAPEKKVTGVARFSNPAVREKLESWGIETISCDLLHREEVERLPQAENVVFMAGRKFGTTGGEPLTWALNAYVPGIVGEVFRNSRIVVFSTACVYPYVNVLRQGAAEDLPPNPPPGEYANSCVGRERIFQYHSGRHGTPGRLIRLSYAIDMRYGVLHDIARSVLAGRTIDLTMGHANVIWQGDANAQALRAFHHCSSPMEALNVSGPEVMSVRAMAEAFGRLFNRPPVFAHQEGERAWLVNTSEAARLFGDPVVPLERMVTWTADWVSRSLPSLNLATHYDVQNGSF